MKSGAMSNVDIKITFWLQLITLIIGNDYLNLFFLFTNTLILIA